MKNQEIKKVTQYKNQVNSIPMRQWTKEEMNLFFAVLTQMKDEGTREIHLDKYSLAEIAQYTITHNKRYHDTMESLAKKLQSLTYFEKTKNSFEMMPFFTKFKAAWIDDLSDMDLVIKVNEEFEYILNKWQENNWTKFMLDEFIEIESTYSKTLFRLLKQWRTKGKREFTIEEFRRLMDIPESYPNGMINSRIVKNGVKDLSKYFEKLKYKAIQCNRKGSPITGFEFTWVPEKTNDFDKDKYNKKSKTKSLADEDNRMTKEEREEVVRRKLKQRLPIKRKEIEETEEIKNVEGQVDIYNLK